MKNYKNIHTEDLIQLIENPIKRKEDVKTKALKELELRNVPLKDQHRIAVKFYKEKMKLFVQSNIYTEAEYKLPYSHYLAEDHKKRIFKKEFKDFMGRRSSLRTNPEKYA